MSTIALRENSNSMKKPNMSPVEYAKMILEKVSFEPRIFKKELRKALKQSSKQEFEHLMTWCREKFRRRK
ncbi:MAG: hypothetical protein U5N85_19515 [Arcicella sp.]|nr:hypothetical protein [Arcicella sp.]